MSSNTYIWGLTGVFMSKVTNIVFLPKCVVIELYKLDKKLTIALSYFLFKLRVYSAIFLYIN